MANESIDTETVNSERVSKWVYINYFIFWILYSILLNLNGC